LSLKFSFWHRRLRLASGYFSSGNNTLAQSAQIKTQLTLWCKGFPGQNRAYCVRLLQGSKTIRIGGFPFRVRERDNAGSGHRHQPGRRTAKNSVRRAGIV
jgi:hypothetical protein